MQFKLRTLFLFTTLTCLLIFAVVPAYENWDVLNEESRLFIGMLPFHLWFAWLAWFAYRIGRFVKGVAHSTRFLQASTYVLTLTYFAAISRVVLFAGVSYMGGNLIGPVLVMTLISSALFLFLLAERAVLKRQQQGEPDRSEPRED